MPEKQKIAVIGTGIAGMAAAYYLRRRFDVIFYEKDNRPGGHTNTVIVQEDGADIPIDTGFIVYNEVTYPRLCRFFEELCIPTKASSMSFSVQHLPSGLEYCGTGISGLYAQKKNILNPFFFRFLMEIDRFNRISPAILEDQKYAEYSLGEYLEEKKFSKTMAERYLLPMSAAIWSAPPDKMLRFPAASLVRFFKNHGLLGLTTHYSWRTVDGGSRVYRDKVLSLFSEKPKLGCTVKKVIREAGGVAVVDGFGEKSIYSKVIIASHADQALAMLENPSEDEKNLLGSFSYQKNHAILHADASFMPKTKKAWSSWNYRIEKDGASHVTYWMNNLQQVSKKRDYFVSINDPGGIRKDLILYETVYEHPVYDRKAMRAQEDLPSLNQSGPVYFCGSYFRYGFHEDALASGVAAAESILRESIA